MAAFQPSQRSKKQSPPGSKGGPLRNRAPSREALRLRRLMAVIVGLAVVFALRLVQFQIGQAPQINAASFSRRSITTTLPAMRCDIVDANGKILATTVMAYDINVDPTLVSPFDTKIDGVTTTISVSGATSRWLRILRRPLVACSAALSMW